MEFIGTIIEKKPAIPKAKHFLDVLIRNTSSGDEVVAQAKKHQRKILQELHAGSQVKCLLKLTTSQSVSGVNYNNIYLTKIEKA